MKSLWLALSFALLGLAPAQAQVNFTMPPPAGVVVGGVMVVTTCGSVNLANGTIAFLAMDHTGALCTNASGGGGGGGLSVVDQTAWVQGTSAFTPTGCVFNDTATLASGQEGTLRCTTDRQAKVLDSAVLAAVQAPVPAGTNLIGKVGIDQTTPGTTNNVTVGPVNSSPTNISAATSGTPSTATTLLAASATHQKVVIKVEGASAVCFSQFGTAAIGATGTWCLKGASTANAGDGGSYVTPGGMTEPNAISMISTGTSILVTGWWQ